MKYLLLAALLIPSLLAAQLPMASPSAPLVRRAQPNPEILSDNYQITLIITDKDAQPTEVSVVVASSQFSASLGELDLNFTGSVIVEETGSLVVTYQLGWETLVPAGEKNTQYKSSATQGSVRLKLGEEVQIIRAGARTARLSVKKLEASKAK